MTTPRRLQASLEITPFLQGLLSMAWTRVNDVDSTLPSRILKAIELEPKFA